MKVFCSNCGQVYDVPEKYIGKKAECEKCNTRFIIERCNEETKIDKTDTISSVEVSSLIAEKKKIIKEIESLDTQKKSLLEEIYLYLDLIEYKDLGFIDDPEYLFETSIRTKEEIKIIREKQKLLIKEGKAVIIPDSIALIIDPKESTKVLIGQAKLMLKAFNIECDLLFKTLKPSNYPNILSKIEKISIDIEKSVLSLKCGFSNEYIELKMKECELLYQYKLQEQREKEEQAIIKEQMKEEAKLRIEYEQAIKKAEKETETLEKAILKVKEQLQKASSDKKSELEARISALEIQLDEAKEHKERAVSMAQQTKKGYVYIISNVGSFGEDVYKIGLSRRLEPEERINELSGASVPFKYDIHAMIYSEDAPNLEAELHRAFHNNRVNKVNRRKEFFKVSLEEIEEKAKELLGEKQEFKFTAVAVDYRESKKISDMQINKS